MAKGQQKKAKAAKERKFAQRKYRRQFKRVQRYLGLRPKLDHLIHPKYDPDVKPEDKEQAIKDFELAVKVPPINPEEPCKFDFEEEVIIICADVEWKELNTTAITELGFAYLDTKDLIGLNPGKDGINWHDKIRTRHLRIDEYRHHVNTRFIQGCPDRFEFGESEFVSLSDAETILPSCFSEPARPFPSVSQMIGQLVTSTSSLEERKIVFIGHDPHGDIDALRRLKFNIYNIDGLLEIIDTNHMWDVWMHDRQGRKLEAILGYFDQPAWNTHNAGNDARYAIQALLAMAVRHAEMRGTAGLDTVRDEFQEIKCRTMTDPNAEAYLEDIEGWKTETNMDDPREQAKETDGGRSEF